MMQDERMAPVATTGIDARLGALPREIEPARDLWSGIVTRMDERTHPNPAIEPRRPAWLWQVAAAVVLVAASSLLTATLLDRNRTAGQAAVPAPLDGAASTSGYTVAMPAAFGPSGRLDPGYLAARLQLTQILEQRIAALPPSARAKLEFNLGEMRRAADEINVALAAQPGDPLLEELLLKTYQDELAVLSNVNQLTDSLGNRAASPAEKRMQL